MKRKFACKLQVFLKKDKQEANIIDKVSSEIIEDIQLNGGEILSISMTCMPPGYGFLYMVFYEDNEHDVEIKESLNKYRFNEPLNY